MTKRVVRRDKARADILDIHDTIAARNPAAALRWLDAVEATIREGIARYPSSGVKRDYGRKKLAGFLMMPVRDFGTYLVFYRIEADAIRIVRIIHGAPDVPNVLDEPG